jgi:type IV pilus assembly protein PilW
MSRAANRGFSLVELMVAMTIGLILLGGALSVLYSSKLTYNENERVARLQESGRAAVEMMLRDMRAGGYKGCNEFIPTANLTNTLATPTDLMSNFAAQVQGYESTSASAWSPAVDTSITTPKGGSDILVVRTTPSSAPTFVLSTAMASSTGDITVSNPLSRTLSVGDRVIISDCQNAAVFAVSAFTPGAPSTIKHGTSDLGIAFRQNSRVVPVDTVVYYIRHSATTRNGVTNPSLWRVTNVDGALELVEGVESMQVLYGVATAANPLVVASYQKASAVTDWTRVISVSIALLIRSIEPTSPQKEARTYNLLGTNVTTANDRYQRTLYTTTVALRNTTQ